MSNEPLANGCSVDVCCVAAFERSSVTLERDFHPVLRIPSDSQSNEYRYRDIPTLRNASDFSTWIHREFTAWFVIPIGREGLELELFTRRPSPIGKRPLFCRYLEKAAFSGKPMKSQTNCGKPAYFCGLLCLPM